MIGAVNPFAPPPVPEMPPVMPPIMPPTLMPAPEPVQVKRKGGLPGNVVNSVQALFGEGQGKPPANPKGTADKLALKPGWGGGQ